MSEGGMPVGPDLTRALESLRDLQVPADGGGGAETVLIAALALASLLAVMLYRRRQRFRALRALWRLGRTNEAELAAAVAALLRRAAQRPRRGAPMPPGLVGERFLNWLDARAPAADRGAFVGGIGRTLAEAPYAPRAQQVDATRLLPLAGRWLRANL